MRANKSIFITGTDTGVGKTLLTALLLYHLRASGRHALAMKPFCSGSRADVHLLQSLQEGEITDEEVNPFYFKEPVAPFVSARKQRKNILLSEVIDRICVIERKCDRLLIEGAGGVFVPLGTGAFLVADLIANLDCGVVVVAQNKLGSINHTLLTVNGLKTAGIVGKRIKVVLMSKPDPDFSARENRKILAELLSPIRVLSFPYLGNKAKHAGAIKRSYSKTKKLLKDLESAGMKKHQ